MELSTRFAAVSTIATLLFAFSARAGGMTHYYVDPDGDDYQNDGSFGHPWRTLELTGERVGAGSVVHVAPGIYYESPVVLANGEEDAPIRFVSDEKWEAKIMGGGYWNWGFYMVGDYTSVEDFDITVLAPGNSAGVEAHGYHDLVLGNHIHDIALDGSTIASGVITGGGTRPEGEGYLDVIGNVIHDIGTPGSAGDAYLMPHGIYYGSPGGNCLNNVVYNTQGWGIHLWHEASDIIISSNTIFNNMHGGILIGSGGSCSDCVDDNMLVTNNIVVYNEANDPEGGTIGGYGIIEESLTGTNNRYLNNLVYGNARGGFRLQNGLTHTGTVEADPQFVDYDPDGDGDYHLLPTSPAIDTGRPTGAPRYDCDDLSRPYGPAFDIGASEWRP